MDQNRHSLAGEISARIRVKAETTRKFKRELELMRFGLLIHMINAASNARYLARGEANAEDAAWAAALAEYKRWTTE